MFCIEYAKPGYTTVDACRSQCEEMTDCKLFIMNSNNGLCDYYEEGAVTGCTRGDGDTWYTTYSVNACETSK